jgi:hypothetical protein
VSIDRGSAAELWYKRVSEFLLEGVLFWSLERVSEFRQEWFFRLGTFDLFMGEIRSIPEMFSLSIMSWTWTGDKWNLRRSSRGWRMHSKRENRRISTHR